MRGRDDRRHDRGPRQAPPAAAGLRGRRRADRPRLRPRRRRPARGRRVRASAAPPRPATPSPRSTSATPSPRRGAGAEAVDAYEAALAGGEPDAWRNLGLVLEDLGDLAGAMRAYRGAVDAGDLEGGLQLAFLLREQGERDAALDVADGDRRRRATREAAAVVACWRFCADPRPGAGGRPARRRRPLPGRPRRPRAPAAGDRPGRRGALRCSSAAPSSARQVAWLPLGNLYGDDLQDDEAATEPPHRRRPPTSGRSRRRGGDRRTAARTCRPCVLRPSTADLDGRASLSSSGLPRRRPATAPLRAAAALQTGLHGGHPCHGADLSRHTAAGYCAACPKPPSTSPTSAPRRARRAPTTAPTTRRCATTSGCSAGSSAR